MRRTAVVLLSLLSLSTPALAEGPPSATEVHALQVAPLVEPPVAARLQPGQPMASGPVSSVSVPTTEAPDEAFLKEAVDFIFRAAQEGRWGAFGLAFLSLALFAFATVDGVRKLAAGFLPWLHQRSTLLAEKVAWLLTDRGGVLLSVLSGQLWGLAVSIGAGKPPSVGMVLGVLMAVVASGAKSWLRKGVRAPATVH